MVDASAGLDPLAEFNLPSVDAGTPAPSAPVSSFGTRAQNVVQEFGARPEGEARDRFFSAFTSQYFPGHYDAAERQAVQSALRSAGMAADTAREAVGLLQ